MNIIICGAGSVGASIAEYLGEEYTITIIDSDPARLSHIAEKLDIRTVLGDAANPGTLKRLELNKPIFLLPLPVLMRLTLCPLKWLTPCSKYN